MTVYSYHFELENGVMTTLKRLSILSLIFNVIAVTLKLVYELNETKIVTRKIRNNSNLIQSIAAI